MIYDFIVNEKQKTFQILDEDNIRPLIIGEEKIFCQIEGEENKEQVHQLIWKLRPDLNWRP